ncbi:hypothetical protein MMC30_008514 [Trapelia coarctata]|nr:hypothetical protein [Trapelia coarctata]
MHSYGGIPGTEALQGLGEAREGAGAVIGLIYIASMLPRKGDSFEAYVEHVGDNGLIALPPDFAKGMFYNDLSEEQADSWTSLLKPQSAGVFQSPLTHETYRDIPSAYLMTTKDQAFKHEYQLKTVQEAGFSMVETIETSHSPFLSKPEKVTRFIMKVVERLNS